MFDFLSSVEHKRRISEKYLLFLIKCKWKQTGAAKLWKHHKSIIKVVYTSVVFGIIYILL